MSLFVRQTWALVRKNLILICARRYISTFIRAIAIPLAVVLLVAYSKIFFRSATFWGISDTHTIRSFKDGLAASSEHSIVGFVDGGMKGDVATVIKSLSQTVSDAGKTPITFNSTQDLAQMCQSVYNGASKCFGAAVFLSSATQGTQNSSRGTWNYTIRGDQGVLGGIVDVRTDKYGPEVYLLPFQRAIDEAIISLSNPGGQNSNATKLPETLKDIVFTTYPQSRLSEIRDNNYLEFCVNLFGALFVFSMIGLVYHLTTHVATERGLGMSGLIDTMIPGGSAIKARLIRQISTYISFAMIYLPSWLAIGIVVSTVVFPEYSRGIPVGYHIFSGLAFTSFSLLGASFFKKAQLSGAIMCVITLVFAFLPQTLAKQKRSTVIAFSLLFPSANYTYFITGLAVWELQATKVDMMAEIPDNDQIRWRIPLYLHWIFLIIQIVLYPILAFVVEHFMFSTASGNRKFVIPQSEREPAVVLSGFCKTYTPSLFKKIFTGMKEDVHAVVDLTFNAYRGQILCLLGPNGSGKSTTLNSISGESKVTSGMISIDPRGGLGYAPQANVIWYVPELTVEEHIRIFSDLKCTATVNEEVISELVRSCDLEKKLPAKASTLSGGQKRKLQLAMMFAGGSAVCCVDEVSTGLDPISRRRIWEILLAERDRRTIIMTTHFLDEADFLADHIAIMYKGSLRAEGTAATLKHTFGNGYTVKIPQAIDLDIRISGPIEREITRHQMVFRVASPALAAELVEQLQRHNVPDYQVSGPTMEELFLKVTGNTMQDAQATAMPEEKKKSKKKGKEAVVIEETPEHVVVDMNQNYELTSGRPISAFKQWYILYRKRFRILRRRFIPYFVALAIALVGAGVAPFLIKKMDKPMACPDPNVGTFDSDYRYDLSKSTAHNFVIGPSRLVTDRKLQQIVDLYPRGLTGNEYDGYTDSGFDNLADLKKQLIMVDTRDEFTGYVKDRQAYAAAHPLEPIDRPADAGLWLDENDPTVMILAGDYDYRFIAGTMNFFNMMLSNVKISAGFYNFAYNALPVMYKFDPLIFTVYYGILLCAYPAFFALYPTNERLSNVRSMQYSNGIRPLPLWSSHLAFDSILVALSSAVATVLLYNSTPIWVGLGYIFVIMFLYGTASALFSYLVSMFAKSAVTAWFICALYQLIMYFAYFGGLLGVTSTVEWTELEAEMNSLFFGMAIFSPAISLQRAFDIGLGQFATLCNGHSYSSLKLFGGPILYLVIQNVLFFVILLWWDSSFAIPAFGKKTIIHDSEKTEMQTGDLMEELKRLRSHNTDLHVENVSKSFGKNLAVDHVTFGVQTSEIFALLGPNGAGKSTIISMIRGDLRPSTSSSSITIAGHSITSSPIAARSNLGVCPQFDSADVLTVAETLRFFARTRGVIDVEHNVKTVIAACGLGPWTNQLAQKLSGGTKRKLSLAVALVGNPRVLVLDEPSSALDANAKRNMWRTLQTVSRGRALVLTTHSMEEADALADRIGIVSSRMLAIGEREALKKRAGDSFHIHLVARSAPRTTQQELDIMRQWINYAFPDAKISRETQGGQIRFEIPAEGRDLVGLTRALEFVKGDLGIEFYSVGKATLDEVFENIVKNYGDYSRDAY
ncbi:P-loop containing nucleoside triphosphate hydrolase protein [Aaosphaeria arxii CBS 175.79]|uniref:P-loop containing nucleoside triphosphate hydrolase protein n=1 Tax=Aaosphaeria arxii CBS 175.79 TaxID=1450172 RepID=A0A6A5XTJ2_9PLEO|nr:P-loop containing nucleoside triphosphate hydrolase protein [Aaosphaeria arxii CBS 175.79]KAF2016665.1 P-loop containing nucleoside triphosphate hydrolase protein [Aaosphaeria arxii CBS 175.79]